MQKPLPVAPIWVDTPASLASTVSDLLKCQQVAVDTESNSLYVYQEQVCLIQFSTESKDYLVDPLALSDLSSLGEVFSNPQIEKIFHAAEYDIICLRRDFGFSFSNLFDTMTAARILGKPAVGLASMLEGEFQISLDKRYQRANWGLRPIPRPMQTYACLDSHYLIALRNKLHQELVTYNLLRLAEEDFSRLALSQSAQVEDEPVSCWKVARNQELTPRQTGVLQALCSFRDDLARQANVPPFRVLANDVLLEIALACPQNREELYKSARLPHRQMEEMGSGLLHAVQVGLKSTPPQRPASNRPCEAYLNRLDALREWRKNAGRKAGVESDVILPKDVMEAIAAQNPRSVEALAESMKSVPYRFERYGRQILQILADVGLHSPA
ncbi:MAG TPA: ribonuclease D [Anaerolineaceae bacterium]